MSYLYYIADVFTREAFSGAQIAVLPEADGLETETMQRIARELNLSETVFVLHPEGQPGKRRLRVFSPHSEIDFAGHPMIAAAYVLGYCGDITLNGPVNKIIFQQNVGDVEINISCEDQCVTQVQFTRQVNSVIDRFTPTDEELAQLLSIKVSELDHRRYSPRLVSCGCPYLIVPVWDYASVRHTRFSYDAWSRSTAPQTAAQEILLFAPKTPFQDSDFNARLLGPRIAAHEDPPIGNAIPAFVSYLCSFESTAKGTHSFAIDRGDAESRRSVLNIEMDNKGSQPITLRVGGEAVLVATGKLLI